MIKSILQKVLVFTILFSMIFSQTVFAAEQAKNIKHTSQSDINGKVNNADVIYPSDPSSQDSNVVNSNNISNYLSSLVNQTLSATYNVNLTTGYFKTSAFEVFSQFSLNASYSSSNNSNFWGIGTGWNLNIPYLLAKKGSSSDDLPQKVYLSINGGMSAFERSQINQPNVLAVYLPRVREDSNAFIVITVTKDSGGNYNFTVNDLKNPNNKLIFIYNSTINDSTIIVNSDIYKNSSEAVHIRYLDASGKPTLTSSNNGLIVYGGVDSNNSYIKLNNIYPGYQVSADNISVTGGGTNNAAYCQITKNKPVVVAQDEYYLGNPTIIHWTTDGDPYYLNDQQTDDFVKNYNVSFSYAYTPGQLVGTSNDKNFVNCPSAPTDINNVLNSIDLSNNESITNANKTYNNTITTLLPNGKLITVTLKGDIFSQQFNNILNSIEGGYIVNGNTINKHTDEVKDGDRNSITAYTAIAGNFYGGGVVEQTSFNNSLMRLTNIDWAIKDDSKFNKSLVFTYLDNGNYGFVHTPDKFTPKLAAIYGLSPIHNWVPLIQEVVETSSLAPSQHITFQYATATYKTFYTMQAALSNGVENPLTQGQNINNTATVIDDPDTKGEFYYVSKISIQSSKNNQQSVSYNWGDDEHNAYNMINSFIKINSESDDDRDVRSGTGFLATTDGLTDYSDKALDVSNAGYQIIKTVGNTKTITQYNRYGLSVSKAMCDLQTKNKDCINYNKTQVKYLGNIADNKDISVNDNYTTMADFLKSSINGQLDTQSTYYNNNLLYSSQLYYDDKNRANKINFYIKNNLYKSVQVGYNDNVYTDSNSNQYFAISSTIQYNMPFSSGLKRLLSFSAQDTSDIFYKTTYNYKVSSYNNDKFLVLDSINTNSNDLRYATTAYKYDDYLRNTQATSCVSSNSNDCSSITTNTPDSRSVKSSYTTYNDTSNTIETYTNAAGSYSKVTLNNLGSIQSSTASNGITVNNTYDDYGRLIESKQIDATGNTIADNKSSYILSTDKYSITNTITDMYGNMSAQVVNNLGQIIQVTGPDLKDKALPGLSDNYITYNYDDNGNVIKTSSYIINNTLTSSVITTYDYLNRPLTIVTNYPKFSMPGATLVKNKKTKKLVKKGKQLGTTNSFDLLARTIKEEYAYDYIGDNETETKMAIDSVMGDEVLPQGSLIGNTTVKQYRYTSDFVNNINNTYYTPPNGKELNLTSQTIDYSNNGVVITSTSISAPKSVITYDKIGRLISKEIQDDKGGNINPQKIAYIYDDLDRLVTMKYNDTIVPYYLYYNDDGYLDSRVYASDHTPTINNNTKLNNIIKYQYTSVCLLGNGKCDTEYKKQNNISSVNFYTKGSFNLNNYTLLDSPTVTTDPVYTNTYAYNNAGLVYTAVASANNKNINTQYQYDEHDKVKQIDYTNSDGVTSEIKRQSIDSKGRTTSIVYTNNNKDNSNNLVKNINFDSFGLGTVSDSATDCSAQNIGCAHSISYHVDFDPRTGMVLNTTKTLPSTVSYSKTFTYDDQGRVTNIFTNDINNSNNGKFYNNITYAYSTTPDINYGALKSTITNYVDKNYNIQTSYGYNGIGLLSNREYYITDLDEDNTIKTKALLTENYTYDDFNRVAKFTCAEGKTDTVMCPIDQFSNNSPINSRAYSYTDSNNINTMVTNNSYNTVYNYGDQNDITDHLTGITQDNNQNVTITYDPSLQRITNVSKAGSVKQSYDLLYDVDDKINNIKLTNDSSASISLSRGLVGISQISSNDKMVNQYYGNGLYNNSSTNTLNYNIGGDSSPSMSFNNNNNSVVHYIKDINGRVIATQHDDEYKTINSYTPYGSTSSHIFDYNTNNGQIASKCLPKVFYGENGMLTLQFQTDSDNGQSKSGQQFQILGDRVYMPGLVSFTQYDTMSPFGMGGVNGWAYSSGNPVGYSDPSGHWGGYFYNNVDANYGFSGQSFRLDDPNRDSMIFALSFLFTVSIVDFAASGVGVALDGVSIMGVVGITAEGLNSASLLSSDIGTITYNPTALKVGGYLGDSSMAIGLMAFAIGAGTSVVNGINAKMLDKTEPVPGCFTGDTRVLMIIKNNKKKSKKQLLKIKDIKVGMIVATK
ncbi:hypothetical protein ACFX5K_03315 [Rickettsiales bacterium LUAb2]